MNLVLWALIEQYQYSIRYGQWWRCCTTVSSDMLRITKIVTPSSSNWSSGMERKIPLDGFRDPRSSFKSAPINCLSWDHSTYPESCHCNSTETNLRHASRSWRDIYSYLLSLLNLDSCISPDSLLSNEVSSSKLKARLLVRSLRHLQRPPNNYFSTKSRVYTTAISPLVLYYSLARPFEDERFAKIVGVWTSLYS